MDTDEYPYLAEGFDPASLTVVRLRKALFEHSISHPSNAKKSELVDIFNAQLKPKAKRILSEQRRIKRTSVGIQDAVSSTASTQDEEDGDDGDARVVQPTPAKRGRGRPARKTATKSEPAYDEEDVDATLVAPPTASRRRTPAPVKSIESEEEQTRPRSSVARSSRRSTVTPFKSEDDEPQSWKKYAKDGPFSSDNPFQSGSSPPTAQPVRQRRSEGIAVDTERKRRKSESRRRTADPAARRKSVTKELGFNIPVRRSLTAQEDDGIATGEEFEPEEQLALQRAQQAGEVVPVQRRRPKQAGSSAGVAVLAVSAIFAAALGGLWRDEKFKVGYCGIGSPSTRIQGVDVPEWADQLRPQCEVCPQHATCYPNLHTECDKDFILKQHPLSVNGLLPLPPSCEPDSEKEKRIKRVADFAVDKLRTASAAAECGEADTAEIHTASLKAIVESSVKKNISPEELEELFNSAIGDVEEREEVITTTDE